MTCLKSITLQNYCMNKGKSLRIINRDV